jgi:hypothetical protein
MYFSSVLVKLNHQIPHGFFESKGQAKLEEYYRYFLIFKQDYRWLLMFAIARLPLARTLGRFFYGDRYQAAEKNYFANRNLSIFRDLEPEVALKSIEQDGYYPGLQLPEGILQELLEYADTADISIDGKSGFEFKYQNKNQAGTKYKCKIITGNYLAVNTECSAMQKLVNDPKLREIAAKYLGKEPILVRSQMSWTFIGSKAAYAQKGVIGSPTVLFHYDLDDYRTLKFFFYLTDVSSLSGSHRCVSGSHKKRKLLHFLVRGQSDEAIADYYGTEKIVDICGRAGFGFAEDPFCFHRGSPPTSAHRLMIQLEFALNDYGMWKL